MSVAETFSRRRDVPAERLYNKIGIDAKNNAKEAIAPLAHLVYKLSLSPIFYHHHLHNLYGNLP